MIDDQPLDGDEGKTYRLVSPNPGPPKNKQVKIYLPEADVRALLLLPISLSARSALENALGSFLHNRHKL